MADTDSFFDAILGQDEESKSDDSKAKQRIARINKETRKDWTKVQSSSSPLIATDPFPYDSFKFSFTDESTHNLVTGHELLVKDRAAPRSSEGIKDRAKPSEIFEPTSLRRLKVAPAEDVISTKETTASKVTVKAEKSKAIKVDNSKHPLAPQMKKSKSASPNFRSSKKKSVWETMTDRMNNV